MTRDKFLCEKMGDKWHIPDYFSTWEGFGKLWEFAKEQEWFPNLPQVDWEGDSILVDTIHPDRFADAVAHYLGWRGK